jgi:hypothetical protein
MVFRGPLLGNGMSAEFNYQRRRTIRTRTGRTIDLGEAGSFDAIHLNPGNPPEEVSLHGRRFQSIHRINSHTGPRVFTAYRSEEDPAILFVVWSNYPFNTQIETGGDLMLQAMHDDPRIRLLIVDNSYVKSGWMNEKMIDYLSNGWLPGLVRLGLWGFCHLRAGSFMGEKSFDDFAGYVSGRVEVIARQLGMEPFRYFPVKSPEVGKDGVIDERLRDAALSEAYEILKSL